MGAIIRFFCCICGRYEEGEIKFFNKCRWKNIVCTRCFNKMKREIEVIKDVQVT